jgi:hypothetical protein
MEHMDLEVMKMFIQEGDVFHIEKEPAEDPVAMIMPSDGITSIWSFENNFSNVVLKIMVLSLSVLFPIIQLMK